MREQLVGQIEVENKHRRLVVEPRRYIRKSERSTGQRKTQAEVGTRREQGAESSEPSLLEVRPDKLDIQLPRPLLQPLQLWFRPGQQGWHIAEWGGGRQSGTCC